MPELDFRITGVEAAVRGLAPLLHFKVAVSNSPAEETIHSVMLQAQIQIESARRQYQADEKEKLIELFGTPDRWGQTLRTRLWTNASTVVRSFTGSAEAIFAVPCTYDMNVGATKYFHALDGGEVPLLFLFSGTIFYAAEDGRLQVRQVSWEKECQFRMPVAVWQAMMDEHYPNSAWVALSRERFERLCAFKRQFGLTTWDDVVDRLLLEAHPPIGPRAVGAGEGQP